MLNIVGTGMMKNEVEQNPVDMEPEKTAAMAKRHPDVIVGIESAHWRQPTFTSVERAVEAGRLANLPVMVDFGSFLPERPYQQMVLEILETCMANCRRFLLQAGGPGYRPFLIVTEALPEAEGSATLCALT